MTSKLLRMEKRSQAQCAVTPACIHNPEFAARLLALLISQSQGLEKLQIIPAPMSGCSHLPITPAPRDVTPSPGIHRHTGRKRQKHNTPTNTSKSCFKASEQEPTPLQLPSVHYSPRGSNHSCVLCVLEQVLCQI